MKKKFKFLIGVQTIILITTVTLPVKAAINIGAPPTLSGSVVTLKTNVPVTTQVTPVPTTSTPATQTTVTTPTTTYVQTSTPTQTQSVRIGQPTSSGNVISLKNIVIQPTSIPVTVTSPVTTTSSAIPATTTTTTTPPVIPSLTEITANEQKMIDMINQERIAVGVNPLKLDLRLAAVGRAKANDMVINNYFSHTSPTYGNPWAMMRQVGLTVGWAGENIALNKSVEGAMAGFMQSPGHRANILDPRFTHVGIGVAGNIHVQEFLQEK